MIMLMKGPHTDIKTNVCKEAMWKVYIVKTTI